MLNIFIPGGESLVIRHLLLDYNGTLAVDGELLPGVAERLRRLSEQLEIHVLTADTHGTVVDKLAGLPCRVTVIASDRQDQRKLDYLLEIGPEMTVAVGNGRNDALMLRRALLGICLVQSEGASSLALAAADVVAVDIAHVFDMLINPWRIAATLRN
jgi:soluble P-type ATPase